MKRKKDKCMEDVRRMIDQGMIRKHIATKLGINDTTIALWLKEDNDIARINKMRASYREYMKNLRYDRTKWRPGR